MLKKFRNFMRRLFDFGMADIYFNEEKPKAPPYCVASGNPCNKDGN